MHDSSHKKQTPPRRGEKRPPSRWDAGVLLILCAGLLLRLPLLPHVGYAPDVGFWKSWMSYAAAFGIPHVYDLDLPGQAYPPVLLYLLGGLGHLYGLLVPSGEDSALATALVKLPAVVLGDLAVAALLSVFAMRWRRPEAGTQRGLSPRGAAALVAFHPAMLWLSSYWGQVDVLLGGLVAAGWLALLAGRSGLGGVLLALAVLTKPQGLIVLPPAIALALASSGRAGLTRALLAGSATTVAVSAPFVFAGAAPKLLGLYVGSSSVYPFLSLNAFNPWWGITLLSGGGRDAELIPDDTGALPLRWIGLALFLAATAWSCWRCLRLGRAHAYGRDDARRERRIEQGMRLLTLQWLFFFLLPTQIHERYLVPALVSFAVVVVLRRRWLGAYAAMSLAVLLNLLYVVPGSRAVLSIVRVVSGEGLLAAAMLVALAVLLVRQEMRTDAAVDPSPDHGGGGTA